ncbi:DUF4157 domain-containing protein [Cellvibrio sp. UBA7671]|uniref:eCIS core domain-containing protein n=1 Tax=Cellvibrio sp. UBA7671 TaxID=1946312 RepID=UPI002F353903
MKAHVPASADKANQSNIGEPQLTSLLDSSFEDARSDAVVQQKLQSVLNASPRIKQMQAAKAVMDNSARVNAHQQAAAMMASKPTQRVGLTEQQPDTKNPPQLNADQASVPNRTGLPDNLKSGIENLSGMSMDHVKVHYNSSQPAQLNAHAFAQGSDIHVAPGQEQHLPHEAWHVVQQAQGRVKPTMQMKEGVQVNDDEGLEHEADVMGAKALSTHARTLQAKSIDTASHANSVVQHYFTAKGDKAKKLRQWVSATKKQLEAEGEDLLLKFFTDQAKSDVEVEWDNVRETYAETKLKLRLKLDDETDTPLTLMDEQYPTEKLAGAKSATGYNRLAAWDIADRGALDPATHTELAHVSKKGDWMTKRIDTTYGSSKGELGQGFYTVTGHEDGAAEGIRNEFGEKGKEPRDVLKFRIANVELIEMVNGDEQLGAFLIYILQHSSGYPRGVDEDASISAINKMGKVLIFPDYKTEVDIDEEGTKYSYETFREANGAPGTHALIIGPQARESLKGIRQICARGYLGDKIINEAPRSEKRLGPRPG